MSGHAPALTAEQADVLQQFKDFMESDTPCFILRGSAGTGKTTIIRHIALYLGAQERSYAILAPTGRAARVLKHKTDMDAHTVHSCIYDFDKLESEVDEEGGGPEDSVGLHLHFTLKQHFGLDTVFIVDESSMVSDSLTNQDILRFGSGKLLSDLIGYSNIKADYSQAKLVFIGDHCQLPPVDNSLSPALDADYLREHHALDSVDAVLQSVIRQSETSAILARATALRLQIDDECFNRIDMSPAEGQIIPILPEEAISRAAGAARTGHWLPIITYSNRTTAGYNLSVRGRLWGDEVAPPQVSDFLMVVKNSGVHQLLNGDKVSIVRVAPDMEKRVVHLRGKEPVELRFRDVGIHCPRPDGTMLEKDVFILENCLYSDERQPTAEEIRALYVDFLKRHPGLRPGSSEFALVYCSDPYVNALHVKFGYAMTCHKAQGGEWGAVVVDFSGVSGQHNANYFRWVYTATTRAKKVLYTINAPRFNEFSALRGQPARSAPVMPAHAEPAATNDDPDFDRFSFPDDRPFLFDLFAPLRNAWRDAGITVCGVRHLPYQEQVSVCRGVDHAVIQYHYNKKGNLSDSGPALLPTGGSLGDEALTIARRVLAPEPDGAQTQRTPFQTGLEEKVHRAIEGSGIELVEVTSQQYRERCRFAARGQTVSLDFYYNIKQQWTSVVQVGGETPLGTEIRETIMNVFEEL